MGLYFTILFASFVPITCSAVRTCNSTIPHGRVYMWCFSSLGCQYSCEVGYEKATGVNYLSCSESGQWMPSRSSASDVTTTDFCKPKHCYSKIPNGNLSANCTSEVGSVCDYTCDDGYQKNTAFSSIVCSASAQWNVGTLVQWNVYTQRLCTNEYQCPLREIPNGELKPSCGRNPGEDCYFSCRKGYSVSRVALVNIVRCSPESTWHMDFSDLCERITCPSRIQLGRVSTNCSRDYDTYCSGYHCDHGYQPASTRTPRLYCNVYARWEWNTNVTTELCVKETICSSFIPNGRISYSCRRSANEACDYSCYGHCRKLRTTLVCSVLGYWYYADHACLCPGQSTTTEAVAHCPATIPNGRISSSCDRTQYSSCGYRCDIGCHTYRTGPLTCSIFGTWYEADTACICSGTRTTERAPYSCPWDITHGYIDADDCDYKLYSQCRFSCFDSYHKSRSTLVCGGWGRWIDEDSACTLNDHYVDDPTDEDSNSGAGTSAAIGTVVGSLVVTICVIILMCVIRGRRRRQNCERVPTTSNNASRSDGTRSGDTSTDDGARFGAALTGFRNTGFQATTDIPGSYTPFPSAAGTLYIEPPPAYDSIDTSNYKSEPSDVLPSYEEVTAHPSSFNVEQTFI